MWNEIIEIRLESCRLKKMQARIPSIHQDDKFGTGENQKKRLAPKIQNYLWYRNRQS